MSAADCTSGPTLTAEHDEHRSRRERYALRTIKADFVWRAVNMGVRLLSIPLAIRLLGNEQYGLWFTVSSVLTWVNLSQMGLGGGLINELGKAYGRNDRQAMRQHVSTAYCALTVVSLLILIGVAGLSHSSFVTTILGIQHTPGLLHDAQNVFLLAGIIFAASLLVNAITAVCGGLQETYYVYLSLSTGSVVSMLLVVYLYSIHAGLIPFTLAMGLPPLLSTIAISVYFLYFRHPYLKPSFAMFDTGSLGKLLGFGIPMLVTQCADMTVFNSAGPLIASHLGLAEVPRYTVPLSLLMLVVNICDGIVRAYHGGYTEATARHDWQWIHKTAVRTRKITFAMIGAASIGIFLLGPFVIGIWAGKAVVPSRLMLGLMCIYGCLMTITATNTVLLLGIGHVRLKAGSQVFIAFMHIAGFFALAPRLGLIAIPIAGSLGYLGDIIVSYTHTSRFIGRHLREQQAYEGVAQSTSVPESV